MKEKFEDTEEVTRRKTMAEWKKDKRKNNDLQSTKQKTKKLSNTNPTGNRVVNPGRINNSWSTSGIRHVTFVKKWAVRHELRKGIIVIKTIPFPAL